MNAKPLLAKTLLKNKVLREIFKKAELQQTALTLIKTWVGVPLSAHITGTIIKNGILVILVDNQIWATKLRYLSASLKTSINDQLPEPLYAIQIKIVPQPEAPRKSRSLKKPRHAPKAALFEAAMALHDPELSDALARIAMASNRP